MASSVLLDLVFIVVETTIIAMIVLWFPLIRLAYASFGFLRHFFGIRFEKRKFTDLEKTNTVVAPVIPGFIAESPSAFQKHNQWQIISSFVLRITPKQTQSPDFPIVDLEGLENALRCIQMRHPFARTVLHQPDPIFDRIRKKVFKTFGFSQFEDVPPIPLQIETTRVPPEDFVRFVSDTMTLESTTKKKVSGMGKPLLRLTVYKNTIPNTNGEFYACFMLFLNHGLFDGKSMSILMKDLLFFYTEGIHADDYLWYCREFRIGEKKVKKRKEMEEKEIIEKIIVEPKEKVEKVENDVRLEEIVIVKKSIPAVGPIERKERDISTFFGSLNMPHPEILLSASLDPIVFTQVKVSPIDLLKSAIWHLKFLLPIFGKLPIPFFKESAQKSARLSKTMLESIHTIRERERIIELSKIRPRDTSELCLSEEIIEFDLPSAKASQKSTFRNDVTDSEDCLTERDECTTVFSNNLLHPFCAGTRFFPLILSKEETKFILGLCKSQKCTLHGLLTLAMIYSVIELTNNFIEEASSKEKKTPKPDEASRKEKKKSKREEVSNEEKKTPKREEVSNEEKKTPKECDCPLNTLVNARPYLGLSAESCGNYIQMIKDPIPNFFLEDEAFLNDRKKFWNSAVNYSELVKQQISKKKILTNSLFQAVFVPPSFRYFSLEQILQFAIGSLENGRLNEFPISNMGLCTELNKPFVSEARECSMQTEYYFFGVCEHFFGPILNNSIITIAGRLNWTVTSPFPLMKESDLTTYISLLRKYLLWEMQEEVTIELAPKEKVVE